MWRSVCSMTGRILHRARHRVGQKNIITVKARHVARIRKTEIFARNFNFLSAGSHKEYGWRVVDGNERLIPGKAVRGVSLGAPSSSAFRLPVRGTWKTSRCSIGHQTLRVCPQICPVRRIWHRHVHVAALSSYTLFRPRLDSVRVQNRAAPRDPNQISTSFGIPAWRWHSKLQTERERFVQHICFDCRNLCT